VSVGERRLRVTDNHPFLSYSYDPTRAKKSGRYGFAYVRADNLAEALVPRTSVEYGEPRKLEQASLTTDFVTSNQYARDFEASHTRPRRFEAPEATTDDLMWLFGAFLGDGSIDSQGGVRGGRRWARVTFSVPTSDRARPRLEQVMTDLAPGISPTVRADGVAITWNSVEFAEFVVANGFGGNARSKRVPEWVLSLPESQRLSLVAGVLDSDGCAPAGRRGFSIKSVNAPMLRDVGEVLTSLGITSRLHTEFDENRAVIAVGRPVTAHGAHRLEFPCDARLVDRVSPRLKDAALAQIPPRLIHHRTIGRSGLVVPEPLELRTVGVSEHVGTVPTWDIEVEGTGNFVSQGFIVHNSKVTMKYPAVWMVGEHAKGETLSVAFAGEGQHQDAGAKMVHAAPHTSSSIVSKSVARGGGRTSYRGLVQINKGSHHSKSTVKCDALLIDTISRSDTYPYVDVREDDVQMGHEATVSKVSADQLFYLMSRGMTEDEAMAMIVRGFVEPIARELPMEYALELNRLIELQMEGAVG
jgi:Fe-S cluster assembly scaffold protein SufB